MGIRRRRRGGGGGRGGGSSYDGWYNGRLNKTRWFGLSFVFATRTAVLVDVIDVVDVVVVDVIAVIVFVASFSFGVRATVPMVCCASRATQLGLPSRH